MPSSYSFQLNLDLTNRNFDPHFDVDYPEFEEIVNSDSFTDYCIPSGVHSLIEHLISLANGECELLDLECQIRSKLNSSLFLPAQFFATFQKSLNDSPDYYQCILTVPESKIANKMPEDVNSLFQHTPQSCCYIGLDGSILRINKRMEQFLMTPESLVTKHHYKDFLLPHNYEEAEHIFLEAISGKANQYEFSVVLPNAVEKRVRVNVFPRFQDKKVAGIYCIFENISETAETQQRWQTFIEQSPLPVVVFVDRKFAFANASAAKFHGLDHPKELIGQDLLAFSTSDDKDRMLERLEKIHNNEVLEPRETEIITKQGIKKRVIVHPKRIKFQGKDAIESVIFDITDMKEEQKLISKSLLEKEILLKEIHHRVKNNLAIISGLIELQIQTAKDGDTVDVLRDSQNRIQSIALIHQQLYQFEAFDRIELASYLRDLIDGLEYTFVRSNDIEFQIESEEINISIENAIPCSLIVNEVIINAFKHAFNNTIDPKVEISIKKVKDNVELSVSDNGVGIGKILPSPSKASLGTTLIDILTQQLQGTSNYFEGPSKGTCFKLTFPIK